MLPATSGYYQTRQAFPASDGTYNVEPQEVPEYIPVRFPFNMTVGPTPPSNPAVNDVWVDTS